MQNPSLHRCEISYQEALRALEKNQQVEESRVRHSERSEESPKICTDVTKLHPGDIFVAYKGLSFDGHTQIANALKAKAGLIVLDDKSFLSPELKQNNFVLVKNSRLAWSILCAAACGNPQEAMKFVGVTGTNGKTTTVWLLKELARKLNIPCVSIGTLGIWMGDELFPSTHTTPDPPVFFNVLKAAKARGIQFCFMEVSSHALEHHRIDLTRFTACAFTSFSRDHLDLHGSLEAYFAAKLRLPFELLENQGRAILFDQVVNEFVKQPKALEKLAGLGDIWVYGPQAKAMAKKIPKAKFLNIAYEKKTLARVSVRLDKNGKDKLEGELPFIGDFTIENFCAALLCFEHVTGKSVSPQAWSSLPQVPGRLQLVEAKSGPHVYVDYAHTPDALERVLKVAKPLCKDSKLWVIFGCGGERDKGKRPQMAKIAQDLADCVVVTSDNPRGENPLEIISDIQAGFVPSQKSITIEADRREAIKFAIQNSNRNDIVIVAGKGHEDYMVIGKEKLYFDDRLVAEEYLNELNET